MLSPGATLAPWPHPSRPGPHPVRLPGSRGKARGSKPFIKFYWASLMPGTKPSVEKFKVQINHVTFEGGLVFLNVWGVCVCVCVCVCSVAKSCQTLWDPSHCSPPGSSVHGISGQEYWRGLPFPPPGHLPNLGIEPTSLASPTLAGRLFTIVPTGKSLNVSYHLQILKSIPLGRQLPNLFMKWVCGLRTDFIIHVHHRSMVYRK